MAAKGGNGDARAALGELCGVYWYPLYAYVRQNGFGAQEAEDITQSFFSRFIEKDLLDNVEPAKGRFRTFLLVCMKRFIVNWRESASALKRGGGATPLSLDLRDAEERYLCEPSHELTAERIFERRWALTAIEQALAVVTAEYAEKGKGRLLEVLSVYLAASASAPPFSETAAVLGMTESAARASAHRLRQRYRLALEKVVAATLDDTGDGNGGNVEQEIRSLMTALSR